MAIKYVEEIFLEFYNVVGSFLSGQDIVACDNFFNIITSSKEFTEQQSRYLLKILDKYKIYAQKMGLDYTQDLEVPIWSRPFRILDLTRKVYAEVDSDGKIFVCLKHPYSYKELFEKEVLKKSKGESSVWDSDQKVRKYNVYDLNLILLNEFCQKYKFEISETFSKILSVVEQIWQDADQLIPRAEIKGNDIIFHNASESAVTYYESNKTTNFYNNLLLVKSLGFEVDSFNSEIINNIICSPTNHFWLADVKKFFDLYKKIDGKIAVLVSDDSEVKKWLETFVETARSCGINDKEIKICFRARNNEDPIFNKWIKDNGYGGDLESGRILIFKNRPPKWLFKDDTDVKIVLINKPFPTSSALAQAWINNHSCVIFLGDLKPSQRNKNVVEL